MPRLALLAAGLAAFVAVYVLFFLGVDQASRRVTLAGLGVELGLAVVLAAAGGGAWLPLFVYVAALGGRRAPDLAARGGLGVITVLVVVVGVATSTSAGFVASMALTTFAIGYMLVGFSRLLTANAELRDAQDEIARLAAADERLRIARDVHDLIGHDLSIVALKAELAKKLVERDPERALRELEDVQTVTRRALEEVREAVKGYRRRSLADELAGARELLASAGIDVEIEGRADGLPREAETVLAWAVREGATNVARHSGARRAEIRVRIAEAGAEVEILDDGPGADGADPGSGLAGLRERAQRVSGRVEAGARPEGGFRLRVAVPLAGR